MSTLEACRQINENLLNKLDSEMINIASIDKITNSTTSKKGIEAAKKKLNTLSKDISRTAGLETNLKLSIGARIILRRNLNSDLFNGSMGVLTGFLYEHGQVSQLLIKFDNGIQHNLSRSCTNFELMRGVYVQRHQFPITLSYAITIHKAQGLSLKCAIVDIGKSTFGFGMHYVALSRITEISGLFLLSISYEKIQADSRAIIEYNRLRKTYRNDLPQIKINNSSKTTSTYFASRSLFTENDVEPRNPIHESSSNMANAVKTVQRDNQQQHLKGFVNRDKTSCYANSVLQLLLNVDAFKDCIMDSNAQGPVTNALKQIINDMTSVSHALLNGMPVRQAVGNEYAATIQQDASEFLLHILNKLTNEGTNIQNSIQGIQGYEERCSLRNLSVIKQNHSKHTFPHFHC